ncbi:MAG: hypothetical protein ACNS62_18190, partial [Candidatus Cyclobacteriaceae bacterium M3_2C_046]
NSVGLKVHPLRAEIQNDFNFNQYQLESLKQGNLIRADHLSLNGQKETYLFQLDPEINEIQRIRVTDIQFPASILGQELSSPHKEQLLQGKVVEVFSPRDQQLHLVRLDLLDSKGFGVDHPQYVQELTTLKVEDQKIVLGKDQSGNFYQSQTQDPLVWNPQITSQLKQMIEQHEIMVPVKPIQPADEKMYYARDLEGNYYQTADKHVFDTGKKSDWEPLDQQKGRLLEYGHNFSKEQLLTKELSVDRFTDRGADQPVRTIKR